MRPCGCSSCAKSAPPAAVTDNAAAKRGVNIRIENFSHRLKLRRSAPEEALLQFYYYSFKRETVYLFAR